MAVCNDRVCEAMLCDDGCKSLMPSICGNSRIAVPTAKCGVITFVGLTILTVGQGDSVDLDSGVHAYDGDGNELSFTHDSVDTSVLGTHIVTYTASGTTDSYLPSMCGTNALHITDCGSGTSKAYRTVIVEAVDAVVCTAKACESLVGCQVN